MASKDFPFNRLFLIRYELPTTWAVVSQTATFFTTPPNRGFFSPIKFAIRVKPGLSFSTIIYTVASGGTSILTSATFTLANGFSENDLAAGTTTAASTALTIKNNSNSNIASYTYNGQIEVYCWGVFQY